MKFACFLLPTIPASPEERRRLRPIAARTEKLQQMLREVTELVKIAEDLGADIISTTEHHLHEEGLEMGCTPALHHYLATQTKHIKVGPVGYVLPSWNPLRLAIETAWLDQLTQGRTIVGMARGYQNRWFNNMAQNYGLRGADSDGQAAGGAKVGLTVARSDQSEADELNRAAFEEVFQILKLAWGEEPFSFKGRFWEYPFPYEQGTEWPAYKWTEQYGTPGIVENGRLKKINVVPKPFQKPHPQLFQAFSASESTIRMAAKHGIVPTITTTNVERFKSNAELYRAEAAKAGRNYRLGENIASARLLSIARNREEALQLAQLSHATVYYREFGAGFGWWEGFRLPGDEEKYPFGKVPLPESEWTLERLERSGHLVAGTPDDARRAIDELIEAANPEFIQFGCSQGLVPFDEQVRQMRVYGEEIIRHYK